MAWLEIDAYGQGWTRQMTSSQLYRALGLDPNKHLPDEGVPETIISGVKVYVMSKSSLREDTPFRKGRRRMKRTFAICPICSKHVEAGHLHQHRKIHQRNED